MGVAPRNRSRPQTPPFPILKINILLLLGGYCPWSHAPLSMPKFQSWHRSQPPSASCAQTSRLRHISARPPPARPVRRPLPPAFPRSPPCLSPTPTRAVALWPPADRHPLEGVPRHRAAGKIHNKYNTRVAGQCWATGGSVFLHGALRAGTMVRNHSRGGHGAVQRRGEQRIPEMYVYTCICILSIYWRSPPPHYTPTRPNPPPPREPS